ncbi:MAG: hypothetical protein HKL90_16335 [Elusimicrobia bacterium]|nr:hypothetical protein [Elusimicrobiota bacterium]
MNYKIRRIDPYWMKNPVIPVVALVGVAAGLALVNAGQPVPAIISGAVAGVAILLATQPAVTAVMAVLGLLGGLTTFVFFPRPEVVAMSALMRALSALLFSVFYMVLMDGVVLFVAVLYNLFAGAVGLGGLSLDLDADGGEGEA